MIKEIKSISLGLLTALILGLFGYWIKEITKAAIIEPLVVSLVIGIIFRSIIGNKQSWFSSGQKFALATFLPFGIFFYGLKNLNFVKIAQVSPKIIILLFLIVLIYLVVIYFLGKMWKQKNEITYLTTAGSAICGASAIAITSNAIKAEPEDVSISLISVTLCAFLGLYILLPFLAVLVNMGNKVYALFSASVLQFTGFVKAANLDTVVLEQQISVDEAVKLGGLFKSVRYLGLFFLLPFFASVEKKKIVLPYPLWLFLFAGITGSFIYSKAPLYYSGDFSNLVTPLYNVSWCVAMAAIGMRVNIFEFFSNNALKAFGAALLGFIAAIITFFIGYYSFIKGF